MSTLDDKVKDFLDHKRIAIVGVSRTTSDAVANLVYRKLRDAGYRVFAINPHADTVEGDVCYPDLKSTPEAAEAVFIATSPDVTEQVIRQCVEAGIGRVWMHQSLSAFGSSVSPEAVRYGQEHGVTVIAGACPLMYFHPDFGHVCMRWVLRVFGKLPQ